MRYNKEERGELSDPETIQRVSRAVSTVLFLGEGVYFLLTRTDSTITYPGLWGGIKRQCKRVSPKGPTQIN